MSNGPVVIFFLAVVLIGAVIAVVVLFGSSKNGPRLNVSQYQTQWLSIEHGISKVNPASWQVAIMNADKLLDKALRDRKFKGQTMGERMKAASNTWKNADYIWGAHKIRNQLAHEVDTKITYEVTLRSLSAFKQGLKDLGAI